MVNLVDHGVDNLSKVVRRNVGGHAHGDARRAVDQQAGEARRQNGGLLEALVEVGHEVNGVLLDVRKHLGGDAAHPGLGVTVGGGRVSVDGAEVAVPVNEGIAQRKVLRHAHQRVIDRGVPVGVEAAQHGAHRGGRLAEGLFIDQPVLVHGIQDAAMHRLEAVPHVGQGTRYDDRHGIFNIAFLHLGVDVHRENGLVLVVGGLALLMLLLFAHTCFSIPPLCAFCPLSRLRTSGLHESNGQRPSAPGAGRRLSC